MKWIKKYFSGDRQSKNRRIRDYIPFNIKDKFRRVKEFIVEMLPIMAKSCATFCAIVSIVGAIASVLSFVAYFKLRKK